MPFILRIPNPEHEARCVAAIRERRRQESDFYVLPWFSQPDRNFVQIRSARA